MLAFALPLSAVVSVTVTELQYVHCSVGEIPVQSGVCVCVYHCDKVRMTDTYDIL